MRINTLDEGRLSACDWSLLLKEDFTAALITLILQENEIPSDREDTSGLSVRGRLSWKINGNYLKTTGWCVIGSVCLFADDFLERSSGSEQTAFTAEEEEV